MKIKAAFTIFFVSLFFLMSASWATYPMGDLTPTQIGSSAVSSLEPTMKSSGRSSGSSSSSSSSSSKTKVKTGDDDDEVDDTGDSSGGFPWWGIILILGIIGVIGIIVVWYLFLRK